MNFAREFELTNLSVPPTLALQLGLMLETQAAAGSNQATAPIINNNFVNVTSSTPATADGIQVSLNKGGIAGVLRWYAIFNSSANTINVYPRSGGTIDAAGTNNPVTIPAGKMRIFYPFSQVGWTSVLSN